MNNKRVLIITYYFPPRAGIASQRLKGIAKYLPNYGWEPVILTATLPARPDDCFNIIQTEYPGDATSSWKSRLGFSENRGLQEQLGVSHEHGENENALMGRIVNLARTAIAYPDEQKSWYPYAVRAGCELLKREHFHALISSSGPPTCHIICKELKEASGLPWVADLRDLWTQNHYYQYGRLRLMLERRLELETLKMADVLVTVSEPLANLLGSLHSNKSVEVIMNGFDQDEVVDVPLTEDLTITYTGQLYKRRRDPSGLFRALQELIAEGKIDPADIEVRFYGESPYWLEKEIREFHLERVACIYGEVPHGISLAKQKESQILLLLNWEDMREKGVYTGKLFEYLAAKRPILALGGVEGVVTALLEETQAGVHVRPSNDLKGLLLMWYQEFKKKGEVSYKGVWEAVSKYSHTEMARKFAHTLDESIEG